MFTRLVMFTTFVTLMTPVTFTALASHCKQGHRQVDIVGQDTSERFTAAIRTLFIKAAEELLH